MDYAGKTVVVIGSGATAVTLVPELAKRAAHVTMLQRSPTYVVTVPERDKIADWLRGHLPSETAYAASRWKNVFLSMALYQYCRRFPESAKRFLVGQVERATRGNVDVRKHFTPTYNPWDQRVCLVPDGDLFETLRDGRASVVTDRIECFTESGIRLKSGADLDCDLIVTATGLQLKFLGGMEIEVDGKRCQSADVMTYKGMMCSDIPNLAFAIGYTNASWTLKCDLTSGYTKCVPRQNDPKIVPEPLMNFTSGYVQRARDLLPRQGSEAPWKLYQNYALDFLLLRKAPVTDKAMVFSK
jgi:cation diffusion facilitator CzcD-associated flavoprotein CzcO